MLTSEILDGEKMLEVVDYLHLMDQEVNLRGEEKFRIETYLRIIDSLTAQLKQRSSPYKDIFGLFGFLTTLKTTTAEGIQISCENFERFTRMV